MASRKQGGLLGISGEELMGRIADLPGAKGMLDGVSTLRERVDELQKRMRGLDELSRRVEALERRVDELSGGKKPSAKRAPSTRSRATKKGSSSSPKT